MLANWDNNYRVRSDYEIDNSSIAKIFVLTVEVFIFVFKRL